MFSLYGVASLHGMLMMAVVLTSLFMLLSGVTVVDAVPRCNTAAAARVELLGGGLLAMGLLLIGVGIHSSFS